MKINPNDVMLWLQVLGALVQVGAVTYAQIRAAFASVVGKTDTELTEEDTARLDVLLAIIEARRLEAQAIADGQG